MKPSTKKEKAYCPKITPDFGKLPLFIQELTRQIMERAAGDLIKDIEFNIAVIYGRYVKHCRAILVDVVSRLIVDDVDARISGGSNSSSLFITEWVSEP